MTQNELQRYLGLLAAKQFELSGTSGKREDIAIEKVADALDDAQLAAGRELAIRGLNRESCLLRGIRAAVKRIAERTYGICLHCDEEISPRRLAAVPWSPLCLECQNRMDRLPAGAMNVLIEPAFDPAA